MGDARAARRGADRARHDGTRGAVCGVCRLSQHARVHGGGGRPPRTRGDGQKNARLVRGGYVRGHGAGRGRHHADALGALRRPRHSLRLFVRLVCGAELSREIRSSDRRRGHRGEQLQKGCGSVSGQRGGGARLRLLRGEKARKTPRKAHVRRVFQAVRGRRVALGGRRKQRGVSRGRAVRVHLLLPLLSRLLPRAAAAVYQKIYRGAAKNAARSAHFGRMRPRRRHGEGG